MLTFSLSTWVATHLLLVFCLVGLMRQARYKTFPFFLSYLLLEESQFLLCFVIRLRTLRVGGTWGVYQWIVVAGIALSSCLQLAVLYEVAARLMPPGSPLASILRFLIRWTVALFILLAAGVAALFSESGLSRVAHAFEVLNFSASLINLGLLLVLLALTRSFNISWKTLPAGIVLGFGVTSSTEIGATGFISAFGTHGIIPSDMVRTLGFLACTLIWLVYIFLPEYRSQFSGQGVEKSEIETWQDELHKIVNQ